MYSMTNRVCRVVVRISDREGISVRRALTLYRNAIRLRVSDLTAGLSARVARAMRKASRTEFLRGGSSGRS